MKKRIFYELFALMELSLFLGRIFPAIPCIKELVNYQFNLFTVSSVFAGFSFTTLGILLGMSSEKVMEKLQNTTVITNKSQKIVMSLWFFSLSCFISLAFIIGILQFLPLLLQRSIYYLGILTLVLGIFYFVLSVYAMYDLIKKVYGVNLQEAKRKKDVFEKELEKAEEREKEK